MRRALEISLFVPVAAGIHLVAFGLVGGALTGGGGAAGAGGENLITLAATPPQMAAMVRDWEEAPEAQTAPAEQDAPAADAAPDLPKPAPAPERGSASTLRMPAPDVAPRVQRPVPAPVQTPATDVAMLAPPSPAAETARMPSRQAEPAKRPESTDLATPSRADAPPQVEPPAPNGLADSPRPKARPERAVAADNPRPASTPQPAKRAAGAGNGALAGQGAQATDPGRQGELASSWGAQIQAQVARVHRVPRAAARQGLSGHTVVRIAVAADGRLQSVRVVQSSGEALLDRAALQSVERAGRFPPAPQGFAKPGMSFDLPLYFTLD